MSLRKPTKLVGNTGRRLGRTSLKNAKLLGSTVRSALGNTGATFRHKQEKYKDDDDDDADSCFFHDADDAVRMTAMEMFWSQHVRQIKVGNSVDDEDLSSTGFSDGVSDSSSLIKSAHTTKTTAISINSEMDKTNRSNKSAKTLDPSDLRGGACKKKKDKAPKRIDFTGNIVDSDGEGDEGDTHSRKSKGSKGRKNKNKKSKKKKHTKKKKKSKKGVRISITDLSDDDAVATSNSSFEDASGGPMVSGNIIVPEDETMVSEETKVEDDGIADLITIPKPSLFLRQTTTGTATSAFSADPSITHVMERIALEDEKYCDRQVQKELEKEVEELLDENEELHTELEEEVRRNQRLQAELTRMETQLQSTQLKPLKQDDMEILHEEIQRLQEELNLERKASEQLSKESRSEIAELQQAVDSLREEVSSASNSSRSFNSVLSASSHSENGKSVGKLQGELLVANGKIEELEKVRREQHDEIRKLRYLLDRFKENTGVTELEEKLETSEKETARLRLELENVEADWQEKLRSKEETIEYFFKEVSDLKFQQASAGTIGSPNRIMSRRGLSMRTLTRSEVENVLRVGPEEELAAEPKRFSWLRARRQAQEIST